MIKFVSCLSLLLIYSGTSWSYSVFSTPWIITIDVEPSSSIFNSCIGVLTSATEVFVSPECINQLPAASQFVLKGALLPYSNQDYQQTRLIQSVSYTYNIAVITVNPFVLNSQIQTLQVKPLMLCTKLKISDAYTFIKEEPFNGGYTVTNLNFSNSDAVCNELSDRSMANPLLHTCTRLSDDDCRSSQRGGEVLVIKSGESFQLAGFKLFRDCERKVAVYTKICRMF